MVSFRGFARPVQSLYSEAKARFHSILSILKMNCLSEQISSKVLDCSSDLASSTLVCGAQTNGAPSASTKPDYLAAMSHGFFGQAPSFLFENLPCFTALQVCMRACLLKSAFLLPPSRYESRSSFHLIHRAYPVSTHQPWQYILAGPILLMQLQLRRAPATLAENT